MVTKVDALPAESDILLKMQMARPGDVKLAQGFIAVRNRTKTEVESRCKTEEIRAKERQLFETDALLSQLHPSQWGIPTLVEKIVDIQARVVNDHFPPLWRSFAK